MVKTQHRWQDSMMIWIYMVPKVKMYNIPERVIYLNHHLLSILQHISLKTIFSSNSKSLCHQILYPRLVENKSFLFFRTLFTKTINEKFWILWWKTRESCKNKKQEGSRTNPSLWADNVIPWRIKDKRMFRKRNSMDNKG